MSSTHGGAPEKQIVGVEAGHANDTETAYGVSSGFLASRKETAYGATGAAYGTNTSSTYGMDTKYDGTGTTSGDHSDDAYRQEVVQAPKAPPRHGVPPRHSAQCAASLAAKDREYVISLAGRTKENVYEVPEVQGGCVAHDSVYRYSTYDSVYDAQGPAIIAGVHSDVYEDSGPEASTQFSIPVLDTQMSRTAAMTAIPGQLASNTSLFSGRLSSDASGAYGPRYDHASASRTSIV